jgi:hypothetical protein
MRRVLKATVALLLGAAVLALAGGRKNRARVLALLRRPRIPDATVEDRVVAKLERMTGHSAVHAATEHGCVVLTGHVLTSERGAIVREIAKLRGVDSVVDLMTEHRSSEGIPVMLRREPRWERRRLLFAFPW